MLGANELKQLDNFRQTILDACELAATELVDGLDGVYPNMDIDYFLECIDEEVGRFTYEAMTENTEALAEIATESK